MGGAASIESSDDVSKEDLINQLLPHYLANPQKYDDVYHILRDRAKLEQKNKMRNSSNEAVSDISEPVPFTEDIVNALNNVRLDPKSFIPVVEEHLQSFVDDMHYTDKHGRENMRIRTREGKAAVEELIEYLKTAEPARAISSSELLEQAAMDHVKDLSENNTLSHTGADGSTIQLRIEKHATWRGIIGENIDCGNRSAENVILMLLIDDGCPKRGHRDNCMNPEFLQVGAAMGPHQDFQYCCVMDFATSVLPWSEVQTSNTTVTATAAEYAAGEHSEEFKKVLRSIPMDNVVSEVEKMLESEDSTVTIEFNAEESSAVISCKKGKTTRKLNVTWGTK